MIFSICPLHAQSVAEGVLQQPQGVREAVREGVKGQIEDLADPFVQISVWVERTQGRLVFYRPRLSVLNGPKTADSQFANRQTDAEQPGAASVFVNGDYQASLVPGGYSQVCIPPGVVRLGVRYMDVGHKVSGDRMDSISELPLNGGGTQFIKVQEAEGRNMVLTPVNQNQALQELAGTRLQMHTVSRVRGQKVCQMVQKPATETVTLEADTLFKFDRFDRAGMTDEGVRALDLLMQRLSTEYESVEHVHLIGYTDPFGSEAYNQRLSSDRAATVSEYMQMSPVLRGRISTEGRGATDFVVTSCGNKLSQKTKVCNQPNRRVVVQVTGVRH